MVHCPEFYFFSNSVALTFLFFLLLLFGWKYQEIDVKTVECPPPPPKQAIETKVQNQASDNLDSDEVSEELSGDHEPAADSEGMDEELLSEGEAIGEEVEEEDEAEISSEGQDYDSESSVDDSDLLKRLEQKYGRLPERNDDEDHDYDIEDDLDIDPTWTSI